MSNNPTPGNPSPPKELTGSIGKYNIVKPLGKGAMGVVYLAHDTILERDVALKVMVAQIADDPELLERFKREAKAVAKMTHSNVVNVYDLGSHTDGSPFIAMELLKGQDLQKAMRGAPISLDRKLAIIVQVLAGLAHAHEAGIVHRDIKPANIFINQDGTVKIMDFGVARLTTASMTGTGNIVGTADYMSPEQVKGARVDGRSDLFSVGCMLYELLAGKRPFHSDNLMAIFYKITHEEADFGLLPAETEYQNLLPILKKALSKTLDERYQTAYDFATDLREYLKVHATSRSGQHALDDLARIEPPRAGVAEPLTDAPGATVVQAGTNEVGATMTTDAPTAGRGGTPTVLGNAATAVGRTLGQSPTVLAPSPGPPRTGPQPRVSPRRGPAPEPKSNTAVIAAVAAAVVIAAGVGAYFVFGPKGDTKIVEATPTPVTAAPAATAAATAVPTSVVTEPPPMPTVDPAAKAASTLKAAQAALAKGEYARALDHANAALREDPSSAQARELANRALAGQKAEGHFKAAESALRSGQFAEAQREAESGRALAPGDSRGSDLLLRIIEEQRRAETRAAEARDREAREKEARERAAREAQGKARVNTLITRAAGEFAAGQYEATVATCKEAMALDPSNETAQKLMIEASLKLGERSNPNANTRTARRFVVGKTSKQSAETKAGGAVPEGFEETVGVNARRASAVTEMPGDIEFDINPPSPVAGEKYVVRVVFRNDGNAPISLKGMTVTTTINTKKVGPFPVPLTVKDVAPHQKATLLETAEHWKEDTSVWVMEAKVTTARGETYTNTVTWR